MKTVRRLEMFAGFATFIAALLNLFIVVIPDMKGMEKLGYSNEDVLLHALVGLILPTLLILIGTYLHATKRSIVGLILIFVFAGMMAFLHAASFLVGSAFGGYKLLGVSPGLFAIATMLLALYSQSISPPQSANVKLR